jgi:H+-translocating NAD(P) transhydrogenase subunit alpha
VRTRAPSVSFRFFHLSPAVTMRLGVCKEVHPGERRVAATPESVRRLRTLGFDVVVEADAGLGAGFDDASYAEAGATIVTPDVAWQSDVIVKVRPPDENEVSRLGPKQHLISFLYPAFNAPLLSALAARGVTALAMDQVPRTTRAQKVDALSSTANLTGYRAVVEAVAVLQRPLRGQSTAAGKIRPAKVLVIGAGVAGLSAIGAAKAMGAIVRAFDTRPAAREQVASMGAEFLELDFAEDGAGTGGYAKEMSPAFIAAEMALFAAQAAEVDVIITTALIPGRRAPILITDEMVRSMKRGSVVVDLAAEQQGNCALTVPGEAVQVHGVTIVGYTDLPSRMAQQASILYATNIVHLLQEMGGAAEFTVSETNDIVRPMTVLHAGAITWPPPAVAVPQPPATPHAAKSQLYQDHHGPPTAAQMGNRTRWSLLAAGLALLAIGMTAPATFVTHLTVFVLACFIGYQVIWSVTPALHTPLMSVTNAISGIIVIGGMFQVRGASAASLLGVAAIVLATINIAGGFLVTHRMLRMFHK